MAIREWWLQVDMKKVMDINSESIWVGWTSGPKDPSNIHVIDATGMPTKEEIKRALYFIKIGIEDLEADGEQNLKESFKVMEWLQSLAAE